jgi:hypothetical protein
MVGQPIAMSVTDRDGVEHALSPLSMNDILEFEDKLGVSLLDAAADRLTIRHIFRILYMSVRKHGLTREDILKKRWKMSIEEFGEMFDLSFLMADRVATIGKLMEASGLKQKNPPMLANATGKTDKSATTSESEEKAAVIP